FANSPAEKSCEHRVRGTRPIAGRLQRMGARVADAGQGPDGLCARERYAIAFSGADRPTRLRPRSAPAVAASRVAFGMEPLTIRLKDCDVRLVVPPSLSSITTYILLEQERWFEKELGFLARWLKPGMTAIDIGANLGVYALPMAR